MEQKTRQSIGNYLQETFALLTEEQKRVQLDTLRRFLFLLQLAPQPDTENLREIARVAGQASSDV